MLQYWWSLNQITHAPCRKLLRVCKADFVLLFLFLSGWELLSLFSRFTHITKFCWNQYFVFGPGWSSQAEQPRGPGVCLVPGFPTTPLPKGRWVLPATFHGVTWMDQPHSWVSWLHHWDKKSQSEGEGHLAKQMGTFNFGTRKGFLCLKLNPSLRTFSANVCHVCHLNSDFSVLNVVQKQTFKRPLNCWEV